jgi:hypothetical protein
VFENRRRIVGPLKNVGEKLHNNNYNLYSPDIIKMIKSGRLRWAGI